MITTVTTAQALSAALKTAHAGDTIQLAPGNYGAVSLNNLKFAGQVTITSANSSHPAVLDSVSIGGSSGLTLSNLTVHVPTNGVGVYGVNSSNIVLDHLNVQGHGISDGVGIFVRATTNATISNSQVANVHDGIQHLDVTGLSITGNTVHSIGEDGIRGGGSSNVTVSDNTLSDFTPAATWVHPDAIQFWSDATHPTMQNITITDNTILRGSGEAPQGIFVSDGHYQNVTIEHNAMEGTMYNGITLFGGDGATIKDNLVQGYKDMTTWIRVEHSNNVQIAGNTSSGYITTSTDTNITQDQHVNAPLAAVGDHTILDSWLAAHPDAAGAPSAPPSTPDPTPTPAPPVDTTSAEPPPVQSPPVQSPPVQSEPTPPVHEVFTPPTPAVTLPGTSGNDRILGTSHDDVIGGHGADTMSGGAGNDSYIVDDAHDMVVEARNGGLDTVYSSISSYNLGYQVENLTLTGSSAQTGTGNELNNVLTANGVSSTLVGGLGDDTLISMGGSDVLSGGAGKDTFVFQHMPSAPATIQDFTVGQDTLNLHPLLSAYHGSNPVADGWVEFKPGAIGLSVYVDADGPSGPGGFVEVAKLSGVTSPLTAGHDWIF